MDFGFTEEQEALRELARKILGDLASPERLREIEAGEEFFDRKLWNELANANLLGASLPEAHGGSDYGFFEVCLLLQEQGRSVAPLPLHGSLVGAQVLARFGSDAQQAAWLPKLVTGDAVLALALEEEGNDDLLAPTTSARRDGDTWRLDGTKVAVAAAGVADRLLVSAGDGAFLVDPAGAGVSLSKQTGTSREPVWWLRFEGASGERLEGAELDWIVHRAVTGLCAIQLGVSERALEMTAEYGRERHQFDRPIGSFQAFHQRAADAFIDVEAIRLTVWEAAFLLDEGRDASQAVDVAKYWACAGGQSAGYACQHLHGGIGMDVDYPLHRYYMWAKQLELSLGSTHRALTRLGAAEARP